jgi:anti-anti-sigma factor
MLKIDIHAERHCVTLHCTGRIVLGVEIEILRCVADTRSEACLLLDLSRVETIDAAGLGLLVELHCRARRRNRGVRITNAAPPVRRTIELVNLQSVLEMDDPERNWVDDEDQSPCSRTMTA